MLGLLLLLAELLAQVAAVLGDCFDGLADLAELGLGAGFLALEQFLDLGEQRRADRGFVLVFLELEGALFGSAEQGVGVGLAAGEGPVLGAEGQRLGAQAGG